MTRPQDTFGSERVRQPIKYLVVGRVVRPHGVRGAVLVEQLSQLMESLQPNSAVFLGENRDEFELVASRLHQGRWIISLSGITDRDQAETLRGKELRIHFQESTPLDDHQYYYWQILDLPVYLESGELLGRVAQILETGANDVYVVQSEDGAEILLPAIESVILDVDLAVKRMTVRLLPGL